MIIFAFCIFGFLISFTWFGCKEILNRGRDYARNKSFIDRDNFIQSIVATKEEIESANLDNDYNDIVDDISYIIGRKISQDMLRFYCNGNHRLSTTSLYYKTIVRYLRLAKIGKACDEYQTISGVSVVQNTDHYNKAYRFYSLLAQYYTNAGIPATVVVNSCIGSNILVKMNLSIFEPKK